MVKATIKSFSIDLWSSGDAIKITVVTDEDAKQYPRAGIGTTAPEWVVELWEGAIGMNPLQVETVAELRSLIGKDVLVEYEDDPPYGKKITKVAHIDSEQTKEEEPEAMPEEPTTTQEIQDDDIPF